jgi:hypothetical protein
MNTDDIESGYRQMAQDETREAEALQWIEGLIGDGAEVVQRDRSDSMRAISLRLPEWLHASARELAEKEKVSLNQLIALALAEKVSALMNRGLSDGACEARQPQETSARAGQSTRRRARRP